MRFRYDTMARFMLAFLALALVVAPTYAKGDGKKRDEVANNAVSLHSFDIILYMSYVIYCYIFIFHVVVLSYSYFYIFISLYL